MYNQEFTLRRCCRLNMGWKSERKSKCALPLFDFWLADLRPVKFYRRRLNIEELLERRENCTGDLFRPSFSCPWRLVDELTTEGGITWDRDPLLSINTLIPTNEHANYYPHNTISNSELAQSFIVKMLPGKFASLFSLSSLSLIIQFYPRFQWTTKQPILEYQ